MAWHQAGWIMYQSTNVQVPLEATVYDAEADPEDLKIYWNSDVDGDCRLKPCTFAGAS